MRNVLRNLLNRVFPVIISLTLFPVALSSQTPSSQDNWTATLPLEEILRLYAADEQPESPVAHPPVAAAVDRILLEGRLLGEAVEITADIEVTVLAEEEWVRVPLFKIDDLLTIISLPHLSGAHLVIDGDTLVLLSGKAGRYPFSLSFRKQARANGALREANLAFEQSTQLVLNVKFDEQFCKLLNKDTRVSAGGIQLYPRRGEFQLRWQQLLAPATSSGPQYKTELEPMVGSSHVSVVSTLEGECVMRVLYKLAFSGSREISFELPEGYTLTRLYLNKSAQAFTIEESKVRLKVEPSRTGDQSGEVELVLLRSRGYYHLSGTMEYNLPGVSWPQQEVFVSLHLPDNFDYTYLNGSLSPLARVPEVDYNYPIPKPGKSMVYHQYLIKNLAPHLKLGYTIQLD